MIAFVLLLASIAGAPIHCPRIPTPLDDVQLAAVLTAGHVVAFGRQPSRMRLAMAWAQVALEGGRGRKLICHNLGSIGAGKRSPWYRVGPARFRAFVTWDGAAVSYWRLLATRCSYALMLFDAGAPRQAAAALRRCGYHRSDATRYGDGLAGLFRAGLRSTSASARDNQRQLHSGSD